jgi:hypothetical protein
MAKAQRSNDSAAWKNDTYPALVKVLADVFPNVAK